MIADDVTGFDEAWIIGETSFLNTAVKYLKMLINNGRKNDAPPYLTSRYDCYWELTFDTKNIWAQILNGLTNLLNRRWKLPNYIIVVFSNKCVQDTVHIANNLHIPMNMLGDHMNRIIFERTADLPPRALRSSDPQILLIRTVSKSNTFQELNNFKNKRRTLTKQYRGWLRGADSGRLTSMTSSHPKTSLRTPVTCPMWDLKYSGNTSAEKLNSTISGG